MHRPSFCFPVHTNLKAISTLSESVTVQEADTVGAARSGPRISPERESASSEAGAMRGVVGPYRLKHSNTQTLSID